MQDNQEKVVQKGYKVFDKFLQCQDYQFEVGKKFIHEGEIMLCDAGFHACDTLLKCFKYKDFHLSIRVCEIEASGEILYDEENKFVCSEITIIRELAFWEIDELVNEGKGNLGYGNQGDWNQGNRNRGDRNHGNWNQGNWNQGDGNKGDGNKGNENQGDWNQGNGNQGNRNQGDGNKGNRNQGDWNRGDGNPS